MGSLFAKEVNNGKYNRHKFRPSVGMAEKFLCINCLYTKFQAPNRKYWIPLSFSDPDDYRENFLGRQFYCYFCKEHQRTPLTLRKFRDPHVHPNRTSDPAFILHDKYSILLGCYPYRTTSSYDPKKYYGKKFSLGNPSGIAKLKQLAELLEESQGDGKPWAVKQDPWVDEMRVPFEELSASRTVSALTLPEDATKPPESHDMSDCLNLPSNVPSKSFVQTASSRN